MRLYLDSNVFISAVKDEIGRSFNLLGEESERFLATCAKYDQCIIISSWFLKEVKDNAFLKEEDVLDFLTTRNVKFELVKKNEEYTKECLKIVHKFGIHFADAVHVVLAKQSNCDLIISWNKRDFEKVSEEISCKTPEEFTIPFFSHTL